ncbi:MAG: hypothetical protein AAGH78_11340 [Cyanobacteria bacterium P01_H01_bin.58]
MNIRWKRLLQQLAVWLTAEIILTLMGMDDLADYSEYHFAARYQSSVAAVVCMMPLG